MAAEKKALAPGLYASPFSKAYWRDAVRELGKVRMLAVAAILIAVRVALKSVAIPIAPPTLMINLGFFVNASGADDLRPGRCYHWRRPSVIRLAVSCSRPAYTSSRSSSRRSPVP